jgi:predicted transcriptional regulator
MGHALPREVAFHGTLRTNLRLQEASMAETTITIRVDPELKTAFSRAAQARERTDQDLLREFMQDFVESQRTDAEYEQWFRRQVHVGIEYADAGRLIPAAEVEAEFAALRATALSNRN